MNPLRKLKSFALNFLYNEDRAVASLGGAPSQETISSEIGRHPDNSVAELAGDVLDGIQANHIENAVKHADELERQCSPSSRI